MPSKACPACGRDLPLDAYHRSARSKDGRQTWCRECMVAYQRRLRAGEHVPRETRTRYPELRDPAWVRQRYLVDLLSPQEIAARLGCSRGAIYPALRRAGVASIPHEVRAVLRPQGASA